jgi:hypothetical protein
MMILLSKLRAYLTRYTWDEAWKKQIDKCWAKVDKTKRQIRHKVKDDVQYRTFSEIPEQVEGLFTRTFYDTTQLPTIVTFSMTWASLWEQLCDTARSSIRRILADLPAAMGDRMNALMCGGKVAAVTGREVDGARRLLYRRLDRSCVVISACVLDGELGLEEDS